MFVVGKVDIINSELIIYSESRGNTKEAKNKFNTHNYKFQREF